MADLVTVTLRAGSKQDTIRLDVPFVKITAGSEVIAVLSGGQSDFVAAFPTEIVESVIVEQYRAS